MPLRRIRLEVAVPGLELVERVTRELAVVGEAGDVEVDRSGVHDVRVAALDQRLRQLDHLRDVIGRLRHHVGQPDPDRSHVVESLLRVLLRDLERLETLVLDREQHLVDRLRRRLVGHVPHVGDVLHLDHVEPLELEGTADQVGEQERTQVAEVDVAIHRGAAGVDLDLPRLHRHDIVDAARQRVVQPHPPILRRDRVPDGPLDQAGSGSSERSGGGAAPRAGPWFRSRSPSVSPITGWSSTGGGGTGTGILAWTPPCSLCARSAAEWYFSSICRKAGSTYARPSTVGPAVPSITAATSSPVTVLCVSRTWATARTSPRCSSRSSQVRS